MKTKINNKLGGEQKSLTALSKEAKIALAIGSVVNVGAIIYFLLQKDKLKKNINKSYKNEEA